MKVKIKVILTVILIGMVAVGTSYIRAQGTASISGKVVDKDTSQPVANAKVFVQSQDLSQGSVAASDEQGNYAIDSLPAGTYQVFVEADGYARDILKEATLSEGQILENQDLQLVKEGTIEGRVTKDGSGLPDVEVWAYQEAGTSFGSAKTDAQGNYKITGLAEGAFTVSVRAEGYVAEIKNNVHVNVGQTTPGVNFGLILQGIISGKVTAEDGTAIPKANISVVKSDDQTSVTMETTAQDGTYKIENLIPGSYDLSVLVKGFVSSQKSNIAVLSGQEMQDVNFILTRAAIMSGRITYSDGVPVVGAQVFASESETKNGFSISDQNGFYQIDVPGDTYTVGVLVDGFDAPFIRRNITIDNGNEIKDIDFILPITGSLSGAVYQDSNLTPLVGVDVFATNTESGETFHASSSENGKYKIDGVYPGIYFVSFSKDGFPSVELDKVEVKSNMTTDNINAVMSEGSISGRVTLQDGVTPIEHVGVVATAMAPIVEDEVTFTDAEGRYTITNLTPGKYELIVAKDGFNSTTLQDIEILGDSNTDNINVFLTPK